MWAWVRWWLAVLAQSSRAALVKQQAVWVQWLVVLAVWVRWWLADSVELALEAWVRWALMVRS